MLDKMYQTRKIALLFFLITLSTIAFSQESTVHFGVSFNAKITHQIFDNSSLGDSQDEFSYTISANIYYDLNSTLQLISGLSFSHYQINQLDYFPILACDINPGLGVDPYNSYFKETYNTNYLGIPIELRWKIVGEANHLFLQFGFEGLFKIAMDETFSLVECNGLNEQLIENNFLKEVNDFLLLSKLGFGYEFKIGKKIKLFFEPNVEYSLTKFFKSGSGNSTFLSFEVV